MPAVAGMTTEQAESAMQPIKLKPLSDGATMTLTLGSAATDLSAHDIDKLIRELAAARAKMTPVHPAEPPGDPAKLHQSDNLLWSVKAAPHKSAIQFVS